MKLGTDYDNDLSAFYDSVKGTNIAELLVIDSLILMNDTVQANITNTNITPDNLSETNDQLITEIYLHTWATDEFVAFDGDQLNTLLNVAYQNPLSGGDAVYDARVLLGLDLDDFYAEDEARLSKSTTPNSDQVSTHFGKIIPNPNNGTMQFMYKLDDGERAKIEIYDVKGHLMKFYALQSDQTLQNIEMTDVDCGIYFYRFTVEDRIVLSDKIVIQK